MKDKYKSSALYISYYQLLGTFVELLLHSLLSVESQQYLSFLYKVSIKVITETFPK